MQGGERKQTVWKKIKKGLRFKNIFTGLCGSSFSSKTRNIPLREEDEDEDDDTELLINAVYNNPPEFYHITPSAGTMNLATALAAERKLASAGLRTDIHVPPWKSLMTLFEDIEQDGGLKKDKAVPMFCEV